MRHALAIVILTSGALGLCSCQSREADAQVYRKACDAGSPEACFSLSLRYMHGDGVPKDAARAASLFRKACDAGYATGCGNLGTMYVYGNGVPQDKVKAAQLYQKACDGGVAAACKALRKLRKSRAPRPPNLNTERPGA